MMDRNTTTRAVRVGVDIGQRHDYTAIIVTEEEDRAGVDHYSVRKIERLPLGTKYPDVAQRIVSAVKNLQSHAAAMESIGRGYPVECWIDATGVGLPVLDLVREHGVRAKAAILTGTDTLTERRDDVVSIGKGYMVGRLSVLLEAGRLHLPIDEEAKALVHELGMYRRQSTPGRSHIAYNAQSGNHDDLVIALALSVGESKRHNTSWGGSWLPDDDDDWVGEMDRRGMFR